MAEKYWIGNAAAITQRTTIAVTGTWATSDTATITINGNDLVVTVGSDVATGDIAEIISKAFNATSRTNNLKNDESRNIGGQEIAEFTEVTSSFSGSTITLTADTAGKPFTVSVSETTAGTGALGTPTDAASATGPHHWDNVDNWSDGVVPVNTDTVTIDSRAKSSIKYGLNQSAVTLTALTITKGFQTPKMIGLAEVNADSSSNKYSEYRDTYLQIGATTLNIGEGVGNMSGRVKIDLGSVQTTAIVHATGSRAEDSVPAVLLKGTHASNAVHVIGGSVGLGYFEGDSSTFATVESAGVLESGDSTTLTNVDVNGGSATIRSDTTTLDCHGGTTVCAEGAHTAVNVYPEATLDYRSSGTLTTLELGGECELANDPRSKTLTTVNMYPGSTINDPNAVATYTNGLALKLCRVEDVTIDVGANRTLTVA